MEKRYIKPKEIEKFRKHLQEEERAASTIEKYLHDLQQFVFWLGKREVSKETVVCWKAELCRRGRAAVTVNGALASLHSFFRFMGWEDYRVKYLKRQRQLFRDGSRDLSKEEYHRLLEGAEQQGDKRTRLLIETICSTGIRVSELRYITVEAAKRGRADISLKGKIRTILISSRLAQKLLKYARKEKIACGEIFLTASRKSLSRYQIWAAMKRLCQYAEVSPSKVFPHNLRHLFAKTFYKSCHDIVRLADVLGHSSIETTRIYLITTVSEYEQQLDGLGLVI